MADREVPVLIAGGSLVGLSTGLFLGWQGVESLVVERHPGTAIHPRAALFNQRTIELYRAVGLEDEIVTASEREFVQNGAIVSVESLGGEELEYYFRNINEGVEDLSPSARLFVTQIGLEPLLHRRAEELGATVEWGKELSSFEVGDDGVLATLVNRGDGSEETVRARYLVAADGVRSPVRERLGIPLRGHPSFSNSITIYFRADVNELIGDRSLSVIYVFHPHQQGFFRFSRAGDAGFLVVNARLEADGARNRDIWPTSGEDECIEYVREALGAPDLPVEIENVQRWNASAEWAERFQEGPIFLAGDAVHGMPPTGGFGGNTGVQDAHNLAWKLAFVLDGRAGESLLASYDTERRPVGEFATEQAYTRYVVRLDPELDSKENLQPYVPEHVVELGYRYHSSAVISEPGDEALFEDPKQASASPGSRAPHLVLEDGRSVLDLLGRRFVLLTGPGGAGWREDAAEAGIDSPAVGAAGFGELYGTGGEGATLIRPDGFVAWRTRDAADDEAADTLAHVLARVLDRPLR
jgi:2-polyprenyl-6-methoxyphenol hydroxylase-like FAD-dependent oxidoreductase